MIHLTLLLSCLLLLTFLAFLQATPAEGTTREPASGSHFSGKRTLLSERKWEEPKEANLKLVLIPKTVQDEEFPQLDSLDSSGKSWPKNLVEVFKERNISLISSLFKPKTTSYRLKDAFDDISDILEREVNSERPEENFLVVDKQLKLDWPDSERGRKMVCALKLFRSLPQLAEQCNLGAYSAIMKSESKEMASLPQWQLELLHASDRRVNKIAKQFQINNSKRCSSLYPSLFKVLIKQLTEEKVQFAITLLENLLKSRLANEQAANNAMNDPDKLLYFALDFPMLSQLLDEPEFLLNELKRLVKDEFKTEIEPEEEFDKFRTSLYEKHLIKPCSEYVNTLSPVFYSAEVASNVFRAPTDSNELQFYRNWAAFKLCTSILKENGKLVINKLMEYEKHRNSLLRSTSANQKLSKWLVSLIKQ